MKIIRWPVGAAALEKSQYPSNLGKGHPRVDQQTNNGKVGMAQAEKTFSFLNKLTLTVKRVPFQNNRRKGAAPMRYSHEANTIEKIRKSIACSQITKLATKEKIRGGARPEVRSLAGLLKWMPVRLLVAASTLAKISKTPLNTTVHKTKEKSLMQWDRTQGRQGAKGEGKTQLLPGGLSSPKCRTHSRLVCSSRVLLKTCKPREAGRVTQLGGLLSTKVPLRKLWRRQTAF